MRYGLETPLRLVKSDRCHWCGGSLSRIRNVFKGKDSERYYDSEVCLSRGEDREVRRIATAAGRVSSHYLVSAVALILITLAFIFSGGHRTWAHSPDTHQEDDLGQAYSDAYGKCCSGQDWVRISTWETTNTGYRVLYKGVWYEAPWKVKVKNIPNPDGEAKAWLNGYEGNFYVRCFMPSAQS